MNTSMSPSAEVQGFLGEVEKALEQVLQQGTKPVEQGETLIAAARHLCLGAGKRARPMLVRLFGSVTGTGPGALLDVQADLLDHLRTRVVVPLLPREGAPPPIRDLNPVFEVRGAALVMATQAVVAVPVRDLGRPIGSLRHEADAITRALDVLLTGF